MGHLSRDSSNPMRSGRDGSIPLGALFRIADTDTARRESRRDLKPLFDPGPHRHRELGARIRNLSRFEAAALLMLGGPWMPTRGLFLSFISISSPIDGFDTGGERSCSHRWSVNKSIRLCERRSGPCAPAYFINFGDVKCLFISTGSFPPFLYKRYFLWPDRKIRETHLERENQSRRTNARFDLPHNFKRMTGTTAAYMIRRDKADVCGSGTIPPHSIPPASDSHSIFDHRSTGMDPDHLNRFDRLRRLPPEINAPVDAAG